MKPAPDGALEKGTGDVELHEAGQDEQMRAAMPVYSRLKDDLLNGSLRPGERLVVDELKQRYDASVSPIREALSTLVGEGFVRREDNKGFRVSPVSIADLEELIDSRIVIEEPALRRSIECGDQAWEEKI